MQALQQTNKRKKDSDVDDKSVDKKLLSSPGMMDHMIFGNIMWSDR